MVSRNARKCDPICADDLEPLEPHLGFAAAHSAAGKIHELLENLKVRRAAELNIPELVYRFKGQSSGSLLFWGVKKACVCFPSVFFLS